MQLPQEAMYALVAGAVGLIFAVITAKKVTAADRGNERMPQAAPTGLDRNNAATALPRTRQRREAPENAGPASVRGWPRGLPAELIPGP